MTTINWRRSAAVAALLAPTFVLAQYTVEVLHSPAVPAAESYGWGAGSGQQVGHTNIFLGGPSHALLWNGTANSFVDLHPAGFDASYAFDADGGKQVGWRELHSPGRAFATMWSGTASSWVDMHNPMFSDTGLMGIGGGQQVGVGVPPGTPDFYHAALWRGTPESAVDLHPAGNYDRSRADDTDGVQQAGFVIEGGHTSAALWSGTAASFVNLHPDGYVISSAGGTANGQQAGSANFSGASHAGLWLGSAISFIDLNPAAEWGSKAHDTNGRHQVGWAGRFGTSAHATRWTGTASSMLDLHDYLPSNYHGSGEQSRAMGIDEFGNIVGWAADLSDGTRAKAVLWRPVPEPTSAIALGALLLLLAWRKRFSTFG